MNKVEMMSAKDTKKGPLLPRLRFPEFHDAGEWEIKKLSEFIKMIIPPKKLLASEYQENGLFPVIDQSQKYISGWTNDKFSIIDKHGSVIIFGDHTCILKLIESPFAQGADGIKIFYCSSDVFTKYTYHYLSFNSIKMEEYKRHFSILKDKNIAYPNNEIEQQKISNCLSSLDERIAAETSKLETLKDHKKGLLKQLFPAAGETTPALRFPEFRDAGEWVERKVDQIAKIYKGKGISKVDISSEGKQLCIRYGELYTSYSEVILEVISKTFLPADTLFLSKINDVIIPASGETKIDIATSSCVMKDDVALGGDLNIIRSCQNGIFISYYFNGNLKEEIAKKAQGDTVVHLYPAQIGQLDIAIPSKKEQQRIADCLSSLDQLISAQSQKIDLLKTHKKGLMQQLFPRVDEVGA